MMARLLRPISRDKADTLLLLLACCLVLAPHAMHVPLWITVVSGSLLAWRGWITLRGERLPPRWILLPVAFLTMPGIYFTYETFFGRDAGVAMLALLLTFKLLEMRARRDLFVVVCLSFFLMLTNLFYSQSIGTALLMIAATVAILTTQLSFQYTGAVPSLARRLRLCGKIVGLALPLTLVLFLFFPRIQGPLWGLPSDAHTGRTGMSDTMAPGNIANLALSDEIAFRVKFEEPMPARAALYWRGIVLGNYDGRIWSKLRVHTHARQRISIVPKSPTVHYQITLEATNQRWLYALDVPTMAPRLGDLTSNVTPELQLFVNQPLTERVRYDATSVVDFELQPDEDQIALQDWLDLPPGFNPQTHALAARMRNQTEDNRALVDAVLRMFRTEPFRYTLSPPRLGRNAIDDFLFTTRAGFCEHYASAFVFMMRALDIPARVVTGYQGGDHNPVDGYLTVRQADAHAWAEVWLRGRGWVRVDPTAAVAPERIERNGGPAQVRNVFGGLIQLDLREHSWIAALGQRMDALGNSWNQLVLNYTPQRQRNLLESLGFENVDWTTLTGLMIGLGTLVTAIMLAPLLWKRNARDPVEALYLRLCAQMAQRGITRAPHEGPRDFSTRLLAHDAPLAPEMKQTVARFMRLYEQVHYGRQSSYTGSQRIRLIKQLKSLLAAAK
jgi:transglutaminase-like putative cysteine protease